MKHLCWTHGLGTHDRNAGPPAPASPCHGQHGAVIPFCDLICLCRNPLHFPTAAKALMPWFLHIPTQPLRVLNPTSGPSL